MRHQEKIAQPEITREQASQRLAEIISACDPDLLRASQGETLWLAHDYAEMASAVQTQFAPVEFADASFAAGAGAVQREFGPHGLIKYLDSGAYKSARHAAIRRTKEPEARALVFFALGLSMGLNRNPKRRSN